MLTLTFAMGDIIWRMFGDARPIDWLVVAVDALVLLVILGEWGVSEFRLRRDRKRRTHLAEVVKAISGLLQKGEKVREELPAPAESEEIKVWQAQAQTWTDETDGFLLERSSGASTAFRLILGTGDMSQIVQTSSGRTFSIDNRLRPSYERLVAQLHNLRSIMEKPDVYF
jgi:hypothetical protein